MRMTATHVVEPKASGSRNSLRIDLEGAGATLVGRLLRRKIERVLATENDGFPREAERIAAEAGRNLRSADSG